MLKKGEFGQNKKFKNEKKYIFFSFGQKQIFDNIFLKLVKLMLKIKNWRTIF